MLMKNAKLRKIKVVLLLIVGLIILLIITFMVFKKQIASYILNDNEKFIINCVATVKEETDKDISIQDIKCLETKSEKSNDDWLNSRTYLYIITDDGLEISFIRHVSISESQAIEDIYNGSFSLYVGHFYWGSQDIIEQYDLPNKKDINGDEVGYAQVDNIDEHVKSGVKRRLDDDCEEITDFSLWKIKLFS